MLNIPYFKDEYENHEFEEAVTLLLDAWVILLSNCSSFPDGYFMSYAVQIFNTYVKVHLALPDGIRIDDADAKEVGINKSWVYFLSASFWKLDAGHFQIV